MVYLPEEYEKTINLLEDIKNRIEAGRIRFCDLGADLIGEVAEAGFEIGQSEEEKEAGRQLVQAYINSYDSICSLNNRSAELAYMDLIISGLRAWMLMVKREEMYLVEKLQEAQKTVLPQELSDQNQKEETKHIWMDVRELFLQQNASITDIDYQRLDVVVKYLAIENYFGRNDYGFRLYQKLQGQRQKLMENVPDCYDTMAEYVFTSLIQSVEEKGFLEDSEISCDARLFLMDGAHRLALCLYYEIPKVHVKVIKESVNIKPFTLSYLQEGGFTDEECSIIENKTREIMHRCSVPVTCILWPPAAAFFNQITNDINHTCKVLSYKDYNYSEETFPRAVRGIYHVDDIADWKINKKIEAMRGCTKKQLRVLQLEILAPYFRLKDMNLNTISTVGERLKMLVRNQYKDKVENYIYDIIVHTGDNYYQCEYLEKMFAPVVSLEEYFTQIHDLNYMLIKHETPYTPEDFPKSYAFSKDIDIICSAADYQKLEQRTADFLEGRIKGYEIRVIRKHEGVLYRIELKGFLMIQIDLGMGMPGISDEFWTKALLSKTEERGYYIPQRRYEICIRLNEYMKNTSKVHHLEYIRKYADLLDRELTGRYLECSDREYQEIINAL